LAYSSSELHSEKSLTSSTRAVRTRLYDYERKCGTDTDILTAKMGKDKEKSSKDKKKEKRSDKDGVHKSKDKKRGSDKMSPEKEAAALQQAVDRSVSGSVPPTGNDDVVMGDAMNGKSPPLVGALVPFAQPLADEKGTKKILKTVKRAAKEKSLRRGVKEVVKTLRKLPPQQSSSSNNPGVVVLAADISPMDVISHIPVLCEEHNVPYIFVRSRAELGAAGSTKRPTSVVLVSKVGKPGAGADDGEYKESYESMEKYVLKEANKTGHF